jgi:hypothetical protein
MPYGPTRGRSEYRRSQLLLGRQEIAEPHLDHAQLVPRRAVVRVGLYGVLQLDQSRFGVTFLKRFLRIRKVTLGTTGSGRTSIAGQHSRHEGYSDH